jgi:hypothetical protein
MGMLLNAWRSRPDSRDRPPRALSLDVCVRGWAAALQCGVVQPGELPTSASGTPWAVGEGQVPEPRGVRGGRLDRSLDPGRPISRPTRACAREAETIAPAHSARTAATGPDYGSAGRPPHIFGVPGPPAPILAPVSLMSEKSKRNLVKPRSRPFRSGRSPLSAGLSGSRSFSRAAIRACRRLRPEVASARAITAWLDLAECGLRWLLCRDPPLPTPSARGRPRGCPQRVGWDDGFCLARARACRTGGMRKHKLTPGIADLTINFWARFICPS